MFWRWAHDIEETPVLVERLLEEEPDSAKGDGGRVARE